MIKILFIITNLSTGGAETMLLKLLRKIDRNRFEPTVISLMGIGEIGPHISDLGIPVYALKMQPGAIPNPLVLLRLLQVFRKSKPDLVHTWMYHADLLGGLVARLFGCKRVIWGIRHSNLSRTQNKILTLRVVKLCAILSKIVPTYILSCSHRASEVHAAVGYASNKLLVIPNGFDLGDFVPDVSARTSVRAELGVSSDAPIVGLVARFNSQKNHIGFLDAAALLHARMPNVHFVLVGQDVDANNPALHEVIKNKALQMHMHLLGRRTDIPRLMASFDVLASSSHGEAFPNVLGEAMACGVPCVVTDVGDSAEIVGSIGRVVSPGDMAGLANGLFDLLALSVEGRLALSEQARARVVAEYDIDHVAALYMKFYERVIAEQMCVKTN